MDMDMEVTDTKDMSVTVGKLVDSFNKSAQRCALLLFSLLQWKLT